MLYILRKTIIRLTVGGYSPRRSGPVNIHRYPPPFVLASNHVQVALSLCQNSQLMWSLPFEIVRVGEYNGSHSILLDPHHKYYYGSGANEPDDAVFFSWREWFYSWLEILPCGSPRSRPNVPFGAWPRPERHDVSETEGATFPAKTERFVNWKKREGANFGSRFTLMQLSLLLLIQLFLCAESVATFVHSTVMKISTSSMHIVGGSLTFYSSIQS